MNQCWCHVASLGLNEITDWGRVTHICISKWTIIGSDNGFVTWSASSHYLNQCWNIINFTLKNRFQWLIKIHIFSFKKMHLKMLSAEWHLFCLGLNVITEILTCLYRIWIPYHSSNKRERQMIFLPQIHQISFQETQQSDRLLDIHYGPQHIIGSHIA